MKKEIPTALILGAIALVVVALGFSVYLFVRPEPANIRKGVPWQDRMNRGGGPQVRGGPPPQP